MAAKATYTPVKLTSAGNIRGAPGKLCWLIVKNSSGTGKSCKVNDATSGEASEKFQVAVPGDDTKFLLFSPPCPFGTGIRVGTMETGMVVTGGFID